MIRKAISVAFVVLLAGTAVLGYLYVQKLKQEHDNEITVLDVKEKLERAEKSLFGYTRYIDFVSETKKSLEGQSKFLAAKVDRDYAIVEDVYAIRLGVQSEAKVMVKYKVEYSIGFDLKPESFALVGDKNRLTVTLNKPELVATPSVSIISHEILSKGYWTDEKSAIIELQQRLLGIAQRHAADIIKEPAVVALSEKKFGEFLLDFMGKQPGVRFVPALQFVYR